MPSSPFRSLTLRILRLVVGLALYGFADALMIEAALGVDPWTVFAQGVSAQTGLGIGVLTNLIGLAVLALWIPLRQRPGLGTVLNVLLVGPFIELGLWLLPAPGSAAGASSAAGAGAGSVAGAGSAAGAAGVLDPATLATQIGYFTAGLLLLAVASGIYIGARLGPGPRDGLMTGLNSRLGWPIWLGRGLVEGTVLLAGWLLGGNVGLGTVAFALLIGPLCTLTLRWFGALPRRLPPRDPSMLAL